MTTQHNSEIKRLTIELDKASYMLKILMETVTYLIWIKDSSGRYIQVNQAYASFCNRTINELIGKTDEEIWGPDLKGKVFIEDYNPNVIDPVQIERQSINHPSLGVQYFKIILAPVVKVNGTALSVTIGIAINITDQIEKEKIAKAAIADIQRQLDFNKYIK